MSVSFSFDIFGSSFSFDSLTGTTVTAGNGATTVGVDPFAESVEFEVPGGPAVEVDSTEAVTIETSDTTIDVGETTTVGVGEIVGAEVDATGTPEVSIFGVEVISTFDMLSNFFML
ncbi:MAG TPA: hypothetical protein ACFCUY_15540 [Xenococcaceae cyanobacterium]